ncbi:MAG: tyrosine recombinase XerC [Oscillospiraceae bacterium]|nr:tyrosine recombinase XerC [Oscillospiraceae bacterium]
MDYRSESPQILKDFLIYHETIKGHSSKTVDEYFLDLRTFFRFLKIERGIVPPRTDFEEISIMDVNLDFVRVVTLNEVYDYLAYLARDRVVNQNSRSKKYGLSSTTRARKIACIRSFYKFLTVKVKLLTENPVADLDSPKTPKTLPHYLSLEESRRLLNSVDGKFRERDYCIICIFLNCGLRISEIVGLNVSDFHIDSLRVIGKGNKERIAYLNESTIKAVEDWLAIRKTLVSAHEMAMFVSNRRTRISREMVHSMVKTNLLRAGLDTTQYSSHKLRHTAATLMLQNGVDVRTLQEVLGHEHLNTTQIYTHVDNSELRIAAAANPLANFEPDKE